MAIVSILHPLSSALCPLPSLSLFSSLLSANLNRHLLDAVTYLVHFPCWTLAFNPTRKSSLMLLKYIFDAIVERRASEIPSLRALLSAGCVCIFALPGLSTCKLKPIFFSNGSWNNAPWTCLLWIPMLLWHLHSKSVLGELFLQVAIILIYLRTLEFHAWIFLWKCRFMLHNATQNSGNGWKIWTSVSIDKLPFCKGRNSSIRHCTSQHVIIHDDRTNALYGSMYDSVSMKL